MKYETGLKSPIALGYEGGLLQEEVPRDTVPLRVQAAGPRSGLHYE